MHSSLTFITMALALSFPPSLAIDLGEHGVDQTLSSTVYKPLT